MLGWLLRMILAFLAVRMLFRGVSGRRPEPSPRPFDPMSGARREKPRGFEDVGDPGVEDADYEELPRG